LICGDGEVNLMLELMQGWFSAYETGIKDMAMQLEQKSAMKWEQLEPNKHVDYHGIDQGIWESWYRNFCLLSL